MHLFTIDHFSHPLYIHIGPLGVIHFLQFKTRWYCITEAYVYVYCMKICLFPMLKINMGNELQSGILRAEEEAVRCNCFYFNCSHCPVDHLKAETQLRLLG